jgi:hypothetical protein
MIPATEFRLYDVRHTETLEMLDLSVCGRPTLQPDKPISPRNSVSQEMLSGLGDALDAA